MEQAKLITNSSSSTSSPPPSSSPASSASPERGEPGEEVTNELTSSTLIRDDEEDEQSDEGEPTLCSYQQNTEATTTVAPGPDSRQLLELAQKERNFAVHHREQQTNNNQLRINHQQQQQQSHLAQQQQQQQQQRDYEDVKQVELFGVSIVALTINGKERLCLAQISNTLLKEFSYNEIHNRRVALGITCVQCTPIQLEMLRRAGAMPSSSRRCGMITMREAERLCRSFLVEEQPPELPENFYFTVAHRVNYGCKGRFVPARYISSRAKCIECFYCGDFYSPNKFIFHSHRQPHTSDCNPPDSPNINSWRKHIDLDWSQEHNQEIKYAWEDVKSLFNGGTRRRAPQSSILGGTTTVTTPSTNTASNADGQAGTGQALGSSVGVKQQQQQVANKSHGHRRDFVKSESGEDQVIIDVDDSTTNKSSYGKHNVGQPKRNSDTSKVWTPNSQHQHHHHHQTPGARSGGSKQRQATGNSLILNSHQTNHRNSLFTVSDLAQNCSGPMKRAFDPIGLQSHAIIGKRYNSNLEEGGKEMQVSGNDGKLQVSNCLQDRGFHSSTSPSTMRNAPRRANISTAQQSLPFVDFVGSPSVASARCSQNPILDTNITNGSQQSNKPAGLFYPSSPGFIYSQLYTQLMQQQSSSQQQPQPQPQLTSAVDAQLALRQHLWSSLLANLQCNTNNQPYQPQQQSNLGLCNPPVVHAPEVAPASLSHLLAAQLYQPQLKNSGQGTQSSQTSAEIGPFSTQKSYSTETGDM